MSEKETEQSLKTGVVAFSYNFIKLFAFRLFVPYGAIHYIIIVNGKVVAGYNRAAFYKAIIIQAFNPAYNERTALYLFFKKRHRHFVGYSVF